MESRVDRRRHEEGPLVAQKHNRRRSLPTEEGVFPGHFPSSILTFPSFFPLLRIHSSRLPSTNAAIRTMDTAYWYMHEIRDQITGNQVESFPSTNHALCCTYQMTPTVETEDIDRLQPATRAVAASEEMYRWLFFSDFVVAPRVHFCHFNAFRMPVLFFAPWEIRPGHFHFRFLSHILLFYCFRQAGRGMQIFILLFSEPGVCGFADPCMRFIWAI